MGNSTKDGKSPLKPVIREMVRTRHTPPNIVLLVDKIIVMRTTLSSEESAPKDAYRMYLTDDHKSIQGLDIFALGLRNFANDIGGQLYSSGGCTSKSLVLKSNRDLTSL